MYGDLQMYLLELIYTFQDTTDTLCFVDKEYNVCNFFAYL